MSLAVAHGAGALTPPDVQPIAAEREPGSDAVGVAALGRSRAQPDAVSLTHWRELTTASHLIDARRLCTHELRTRLMAAEGEVGEQHLFAVPADFDADYLTHVAAVGAAAGCDNLGFVDSAASISATLPDAATVVVDIGWHVLIAARVRAADVCQREAAWLDSRQLLGQLQKRWMDLIAAAMVKQTRFDPQHARADEQALFDGLTAWLAQATREGSVRIALPGEASRFAVELSAHQFEAAAAPIYRQVLRVLLGALVAGDAATLVLPQRVADWPGFLPKLFAATEQPVRLIGELHGAETAAALEAAHVPGRYVANVPRAALGRQLSVPPLAAPARPRTTRSLPVTHVLFGGESLRLFDLPIVVGRQPESGAPSIAIPESMPGVSRRHCTILRDGEGTVVVDHSSGGTWVNGARVRGRASIAPGDRVRVGVPGVELTLISAAAATHGAPQA
jgi:hypothetical protein